MSSPTWLALWNWLASLVSPSPATLEAAGEGTLAVIEAPLRH